MDNFSKMSLLIKRQNIEQTIFSLRRSMDAIVDKNTAYYEHHQYLINVYNDVLEIICNGIYESKDIGKGA